MKTLEITKVKSNEELSKKQPPDVFSKKVFLFSKNDRKTPTPKSFFQ